MQDNHLSDIQEGHENEAAAVLPSHVSPDSSSPFYDSSDMYHSSDLYTCTTRISDYSISDTPGRGAHQHTHGLQYSTMSLLPSQASLRASLHVICLTGTRL